VNSLEERSSPRSLLRVFLAIVVGCLSAFALVAVIEMIGHALFPVPGRVDMSTPDGLRAPVQIPLAALLSVLVAWMVATLVGGWLAARIAPSKPRVYAGLVGAVILIGATTNMMMIPHPTWFAVAAVVGIIAAAWAAGALAARRSAKRESGSPLSRG